MIRFGKTTDEKEFLDIFKSSLDYYALITGKSINKSLKSMRNTFKSLFEKNRVFLVYEEQNRLLGFLLGTIIKNNLRHFGYIDDIFVEKNYRGKKIGSKLIKKYEEYLKKSKIKYIRLGVSIRNKKALDFYHKLGFDIYYYEMEKNLK